MFILCSIGLCTPAGFAYVAVRTQRRSWRAAALFYSLLGAIAVVLFLLFHDEQEVFVPRVAELAIVLTLWIGGSIHALIINPTWLVDRRRLAVGIPIRGVSIGVEGESVKLGTPILSGALQSDLPDINTITVADLAAMPGVSGELASAIVVERDSHGRYESGFDVARRIPMSRGVPEALLARVAVYVQSPAGRAVRDIDR